MIDSDAVQSSGDVMRRLADLERKVRELEAGRRLEAATIGRGGLTIRDTGGVTIRDGGGVTVRDGGDLNVEGGELRVIDQLGNVQLYIGPLFYGGGVRAGNGWLFRRANGMLAFSLEGGVNADAQFLAVRDDSGNIVVSDDADSGQGLARPYIPIPFASHSQALPTDTTTSATFTGLLSARYTKQHPRIKARILCRASDGTTTGEVQLIKVGGAQIGTTVTVGAGAYTLLTIGPADVPGTHMEEMELEVQARRTAGAGTIGVRMFGAYAQQS